MAEVAPSFPFSVLHILFLLERIEEQCMRLEQAVPRAAARAGARRRRKRWQWSCHAATDIRAWPRYTVLAASCGDGATRHSGAAGKCGCSKDQATTATGLSQRCGGQGHGTRFFPMNFFLK